MLKKLADVDYPVRITEERGAYILKDLLQFEYGAPKPSAAEEKKADVLIKWGRIDAEGHRARWDECKYEEYQTADVTPVRLHVTEFHKQRGPVITGIAWLFQRTVYVTTEYLRPEDVVALVLENQNKVKARLAGAHALTEQVAVVEQGGRKPIPDDTKVLVWQRDQGKCVRCGSNESLEFDHIIPVSMGGSDSARNLQLLCEPCNRSKGGSLV